MVTEHHTLTEALSLSSRELLAAVGGGGKTSALQLLAQELSRRGAQILATTTTHMFLGDLEIMGPVLVESAAPALQARLDAALVEDGRICAARAVDEEGKVTGLPAEWVDELWAAAWVDYLLVEADGSKGMSLKAFADQEPQVPSAATIIVQVAGLDVLGAPLTGSHVHRPELLAAALGVPLGAEITTGVLAGALRTQLQLLGQRWPAARVVTLLNKAENGDVRQAGLKLATQLLSAPGKGEAQPAPDAVVVGSVKQREFFRVSAGGEG